MPQNKSLRLFYGQIARIQFDFRRRVNFPCASGFLCRQNLSILRHMPLGKLSCVSVVHQLGATIPLTLTYKLNHVCNAGSVPAIQAVRLASPKAAHKNQLQLHCTTIYCACQELFYICCVGFTIIATVLNSLLYHGFYAYSVTVLFWTAPESRLPPC